MRKTMAEILIAKGRKEGYEEGYKEGLPLGRLKALRGVLLRLLRLRFGVLRTEELGKNNLHTCS